MKIFKTHEEQLAILKKRGLHIPNDQYAIGILEHENYYSIINGYKDLFIATTSPDDYYKPNATFNEITALYSFDRRLSELLLIELLRIERSIRTKIIYVFSEKHGHNHNAYLMPDSFNIAEQTNFTRVSNLICELNNLINSYEKKHSAINHYITKHKYVPLWVLSNVITFGKMNSFYAIMLCDEKEIIAKAFDLDSSSFKTIIDMLAEFRNKCAHGERIYCYSKDRGRSKRIPYLQIHEKLNIPQNKKGYKYGTQDILALLISMKTFVSKERYGKLLEKINCLLHDILDKQLNSISIEDVKNVMGLRDHWLNLKSL